MRLVVQVAKDASCEVDGRITGSIDYGYLVLIGITNEDTKEIADKMLAKLLKLRILPDDNGKTNLSIIDKNGSLLIVSQFTLYADMTHGNRPNFLKAGSPDYANSLYEYFVSRAREEGINVGTGEFGADMHINFTNEGPFTVIMDSDELIKK